MSETMTETEISERERKLLQIILDAPGDPMSKRQLSDDIRTLAEICGEIIIRMGAHYGDPADTRKHLQMLGELREAHASFYARLDARQAAAAPVIVPPPGGRPAADR